MAEINKTKNEYIKARELLIEQVKTQVLGPGSEYNIPDKEHEIITDKPSNRYSCGILYPQETNHVTKEREDELDLVADEEPGVEKMEYDEKQDAEDDLWENRKRTEKAGAVEMEATEDDSDETVRLSDQDKPSSFGIAFLVRGDANKIRCEFTAGMYRSLKLEECKVPNDGEFKLEELPIGVQEHIKEVENGKYWGLNLKLEREWINGVKKNNIVPEHQSKIYNTVLYPLAKQCDHRTGFIRMPLSKTFELDFSSGRITNLEPFEGVACRVTGISRPMGDGITSITIMVVNTAKSEGQAEQDKMIFQPKLSIVSQDGYHFVDNSFMSERFIAKDSEELRLAMLYQDKKCYASGLGTSVNWDIKEDGQGMINNTFFPEKELQSMDFELDETIAKHEREILSMKYHSDLDGAPIEEKVGYLQELMDAYGQWIIDRKKEIDKLPQKFQTVASENMADCEDALRRMQNGLRILSENKIVQTAFALANRAMFMQRIHLAKQQELGEEKPRFAGDAEVQKWLRNIDYASHSDEKTKWRPFQLAFMLMSIPGIVDEKAEDRKLVDLIWFPTGGGKTEAYLGLAAFVIFYRRLAYPNDYGGTNIIMRYTLRLLTAQQFNRAATLICACELIRQKSCQSSNGRRRRNVRAIDNGMNLGDERITIGIWIGSAHTPNKVDDARIKLKKLKRGEGKNVFQVLKCPWCGTLMVGTDKNDFY